jgi:ABC-type transport system involved in multi-copper enzyme maturation permease subunit
VTWVAWRLQRTETLITLGILALLAALLVPTGINMAHAYHQAGLGSCNAVKSVSACGQNIGDFQSRFESLTQLTDWFTLLPGLIGVLLAAPFIFDLEHGTYRLAWTQSITRRRWLLGKLGMPIAAGVVAAGALILLLTWWRVPVVHLNGNRLDNGTYDAEGTVAIGYTIFALGLALALGAVWRRAAASLTVAFVAYFAMRIFVDTWLRDRLVPPLTTTWKGTQPSRLNHAEILREHVVGHANVNLAGGGVLGGHAQLAVPGGRNGGPVIETIYQPASHFWPLQLAETGLFLGLAALLIGFAAWWTHERTV